MIADRMIEQGTLSTEGDRTAVEVRIPWYRALPGSCIAGASLTIDGVAAPGESLRWTMNNRTFTFEELVDETGEWWYPLDSAVLSGELPLSDPDAEHEVRGDRTDEPVAQREARVLEHPVPERHDDPALLRHRDEGRGGQQPVRRVLPPCKGLRPDDRAQREVPLALVVHDQPVTGDRLTQFGLALETSRDGDPQRLVVDLHLITTATLRPVHR